MYGLAVIASVPTLNICQILTRFGMPDTYKFIDPPPTYLSYDIHDIELSKFQNMFLCLQWFIYQTMQSSYVHTTRILLRQGH